MKLDLNIPKYIKDIVEELNKYGYECYLVGGCIRDVILNKEIHDYDLATNCTSSIIKDIFKDYKIINNNGEKHNTITLYIEGNNVEITSFKHNDNEKNSIEIDLLHRDLSINSLAYSDHLIDYYNGYNDLINHIIRANNPKERFLEDPLRILRALRFSSILGFEIEENTSLMIHKYKDLLKNTSNERIKVELELIISGNNALNIFSTYYDVFFVIIPELKDTYNFNQMNPYHKRDIYNHLINVVNNIHLEDNYNNIVTRTAGLFHDIGKPQCFSIDENNIGHFYKHSIISKEISFNILKRLKYSNNEINDILFLIQYHDYSIQYTLKSIRRILMKIPKQNERLLYMLIELINADRMDHTEYELIDINKINDIVKDIKELNLCLNVGDLNINGYDLMNLGFKGRKIGETLNYLLNLVIDDRIKNEKEVLIEEANKYNK